jgi:hypothetical protein
MTWAVLFAVYFFFWGVWIPHNISFVVAFYVVTCILFNMVVFKDGKFRGVSAFWPLVLVGAFCFGNTKVE